MTEERHAGGVGAVRRASRILSAIARRSPTGIGLAELSRRTELSHPTVRRILCGLMEEGLVVQEMPSRRYHLGSLVFELGLCTPHQGALVRRARPAIERLAAVTGDTVYLTARSGTDAVCLDRIEGSALIKIVTTGIGDRRPLGVGAVGMAILSRLEESEIASVLRENRREYERYGLALPKLHEAILVSRQRGYGVTDGLLTPGVAGIGVVIATVSGAAVAGISLASTQERLSGEQLKAKLDLLRAETGQLSSQF